MLSGVSRSPLWAGHRCSLIRNSLSDYWRSEDYGNGFDAVHARWHWYSKIIRIRSSSRWRSTKLVTSELYFDDPHGTREHRRHLTYYFAEQIRAELQASD